MLSSILTVDGPTGHATSVNGQATFVSCPLPPNRALTIDHPIFDTTKAEIALTLNRNHTTSPLIIDRPPLIDTPVINGVPRICFSPLESKVLLVADGLLPSSTSATKHAASAEPCLLTHDVA